jgi:hypothetical protein
MKHYPALLLSMLLMCCFTALHAQDEEIDSTGAGFEGFRTEKRKMPEHANVFKVSPVPFFVGQIPICGEMRLTYERIIAPGHSLVLGGAYNYPNIFLLVMSAVADTAVGFKDYSFRGGRGIFGYRFYPLKGKTAPEGFYVGPYFSYNFVKVKEKGGNDDFYAYHYVNGSVVAGYQLHLRGRVYMDFMGGLGYRNNFIVEYDSRTQRRVRYEMEGIPFIKNVKLVIQYNLCFGL